VDGPDGYNFSNFWAFDHFYPERRSGAFYLRPVLNMKKLFRRINKYAHRGIDILVRLFLGLAYFILFFPFALIIRMRTDYLETKTKLPCWAPLEEIKDQKELLTHQ
jgi:hypothetical protein